MVCSNMWCILCNSRSRNTKILSRLLVPSMTLEPFSAPFSRYDLHEWYIVSGTAPLHIVQTPAIIPQAFRQPHTRTGLHTFQTELQNCHGYLFSCILFRGRIGACQYRCGYNTPLSNPLTFTGSVPCHVTLFILMSENCAHI